ncbi:MAG TPA: hypothetical protein VGO93_31840 [Candidatus Xenobia bacterium]|jgi:hypothetical protein
MRYTCLVLLLGGLMCAAVSAQSGIALAPQRTTLPIHPHAHWLVPSQMTQPGILNQGQEMFVQVQPPAVLGTVPAMRGETFWMPPDNSHFYQYRRPIFPLVQFPGGFVPGNVGD